MIFIVYIYIPATATTTTKTNHEIYHTLGSNYYIFRVGIPLQ